LQYKNKNCIFAFRIKNVKAMKNIGKVINVDTDILGGTPVFCGTRVPVKNLFDYLETGETVNDFLQDFDSVKPYQAIRVLEMSKKLIETSSSILV
jgi:uncharacterized protein (DUF433 family)